MSVKRSSVASPTPQSLVIRGPSGSISGFDRHVRDLARAFTELGVEVGLVDVPECRFMALPERGRERLFKGAVPKAEARTALHICMPNQVRPLSGRLNVNLATFEATRIFPDWVRHGRAHDLVVVPTEFARRAWVASGVPAERIRVCPQGVDTRRFNPDVRPLSLGRERGRPVLDYRVRVLNVSAIGTRKNLFGLIRLWLEHTSASDDAILIVKLSWNDQGMFVRFLRDVAALTALLGRSPQDAAPIRYVVTSLSDRDMPRLYASATHYISLSHGEGWDFPMIEAGSCGVHLIAPRHSAYTTYLDDSVARMIPARRVPADWIESNFGRSIRGAMSWAVDETAAASALRDAIDGRRFPTARQRIHREFDWVHSASQLLRIIGDLEARKAVRRLRQPSAARAVAGFASAVQRGRRLG